MIGWVVSGRAGQGTLVQSGGGGPGKELIVKTGHRVLRNIVSLVSNPGLLCKGMPDVENVVNPSILSDRLDIEYLCTINGGYLIKVQKLCSFTL